MLENYEIVQTINDEHKIYLVKNILNGSFYVKKELSIFDSDIYNYLLKNHFSGIPCIKELIEQDNKLIVIEEYIPGNSIEILLDNNKLFTEEETKDVILKLCSILKNLNKNKDFVHRDIKPSNLILKDNNELYLIDFNAAKFTSRKSRDTVLLGTEGYAAPEQYGFAESNIQSDIYAIGVLMKEMLTGTNKLDDDYNGSLKHVINKCTKLDPHSRYQEYDDLIYAIKNSQKYIKDNRYLLVGFRSKKWWKITIASIVYLFIFLIGFVIRFDETAEGVTVASNFVLQIGITSTFLVMILFAGNYLNCHDFFRINPKWNIITRILVVTIIDLFLGISCLFVSLIFATLI